MARFLLRPRWLAGLGLVVLVTVTFVRLGFWQLDRLDQRHAFEDLVASRLAAPPAPLAEVLASGEDLRYRRVVADGTFDPDHEVILYGRTQSGQTGNHVLTPLVLSDGSAIAVDRGWVPLSDDDPPLADAAPPGGEVIVTGVLFPPEAGGPPDADGGPSVEPGITTFARVDLAALSSQVPFALAPAYLLLDSQRPAQATLPAAAPLPDPSGSPPHLSYAIQWFTFAAIAVVGFVILVRREHRRTMAIEAALTAEAPSI